MLSFPFENARCFNLRYICKCVLKVFASTGLLKTCPSRIGQKRKLDGPTKATPIWCENWTYSVTNRIGQITLFWVSSKTKNMPIARPECLAPCVPKQPPGAIGKPEDAPGKRLCQIGLPAYVRSYWVTLLPPFAMSPSRIRPCLQQASCRSIHRRGNLFSMDI
jgi:hypothetical protein